MKPFRTHHLLRILSSFEKESLPLDVFLRSYFRNNKAVGSKDRKEICDTLYGMIRWRGLLDTIGNKPSSWENRLHAFEGFSSDKWIKETSLPPHIRVSFPKEFYNLLSESLGEEKAFSFCLSSNTPAPTTVRANLLKISRSELLSLWEGKYKVKPCRHASTAICFEEKISFFGTEEFKAGYFEVQDEASQLVAEKVAIRPGQQFLDYCAGSGGKSLAIAPQMQGKGQLFLHDIRPFALLEAKKRLKRAGIQNAQTLAADSPYKQQLQGKIDWVLVDAPCSGSGTLRRNPDMKWKFEKSMVERLVQEQRGIFQEALSFVKPGGYIVYATCSVFPQENEEQAAYFLSQFPLQVEGEPFHSFPAIGEMDGFFAIVFKKKKD